MYTLIIGNRTGRIDTASFTDKALAHKMFDTAGQMSHFAILKREGKTVAAYKDNRIVRYPD